MRCRILLLLWALQLLIRCNPAFAQSPGKYKITALPAASYSPETSLSLGAIAFIVHSIPDSLRNINYRPTTITPWVIYSLRNQLEANIDFDFFSGNGNNLTVSARYYDFPDFFYGLGNNTKEKDKEKYINRAFYLEANYLKSVSNTFFAGLSLDIRYDRFYGLNESGILLGEEVNGIKGGMLFGIGPMLRFDSRDNILYPRKGMLFEGQAILYPDVAVNDYSYGLMRLDYRIYRQLFSAKNVIAWQFVSQFTFGGDVPFYKLPRIAGSKRLRGINHYNRYLQEQSFYSQVEYRRQLFWRLGGVAFAGIGNVAENPDKLIKTSLKYVYGIGGRFKPFKEEDLNIRIDLGFSENGQSGLYFQVREAF
jgi:outer membrane protein assembly factor BamA